VTLYTLGQHLEQSGELRVIVGGAGGPANLCFPELSNIALGAKLLICWLMKAVLPALIPLSATIKAAPTMTINNLINNNFLSISASIEYQNLFIVFIFFLLMSYRGFF